MTQPHPPFPEPLDDDDDDVAWALQTAKVQWTRGGRSDAVVWLRRAVDSADQLGNVWRASDLRRMTDAIEANLRRPSFIPSPIPEPLPRFEADEDVDEMLEREDSGVTSIPPQAASPAPYSSYAPVDDLEFEEDIVLEDDAEDEESNSKVGQLLGDEVELTEEVDVIDDEDLADDEDELASLDDDVIEDDALDIPASASIPAPPSARVPTAPPAPPSKRAPASVPARHAFDSSEELPTQPQLGTPSFPPSLLSRLVDAPAPAAPEPEEDPHVGDVLLGEVRGLEDVPPEGQAILAREARIVPLSVDEEIGTFGLALVLHGSVKVMPAIADLACAVAKKGDIVWSEGNLEDGVALRLVSAENNSEVAVWEAELLKSTVRDYPWVVEDLKSLADRFQALAGVGMGPMGERLDDSLRAMVTERCEIKRLLPGETLTTKGKAVGGMYIMAAGRLEIVNGEAVESELGPGDFLFGPQVLSNGAAPHDSRAGKGGALVLFAGRSVAHELLLSVPPLLEIFAS